MNCPVSAAGSLKRFMLHLGGKKPEASDPLSTPSAHQKKRGSGHSEPSALGLLQFYFILYFS